MQVTIYSTPSCPYCHLAKEWLTEHAIAFIDKNVADDDMARETMISLSNQMGVPVIMIDDTVIIGFDEDELAKKLCTH